LRSADELPQAARALAAFGAQAVLIKGGHFAQDTIYDVLWEADQLYRFESPRLPVHNPRGIGCTFAACITAELAKGQALCAAVQTAHAYVQAALAAAAEWRLGKGERAILDHSVQLP
jgi:hydroxymethylpyrimidine/phosphomethylpyrimidine kinase